MKAKTSDGDAASIRNLILAKRKSLLPTHLLSLSDQTCRRFLAAWPLEVSWKGMRVGLYRALPGELDVRLLEQVLAEKGAILHYPRISDRAVSRMEMVEVLHPGQGPAGWNKGPYGIEEPPLHLKAVEAEMLDLLLVPGLAYGLKGERIGMGAGYYDRYLVHTHTALRLGLAFDFQLFESLEQKPWDQPLHWVMTEGRDARTPYIEEWLTSARARRFQENE